MSEYETPPWDIEQLEEPEPENLQSLNQEVADVCVKCGSELKWFVTRYRCRNLDCRAEYPHNVEL